jgi:hypothetical protein
MPVAAGGECAVGGKRAVARHASMRAEEGPVRPRALSAVKGQETADGYEVGCRSYSVPEAAVAVFWCCARSNAR